MRKKEKKKPLITPHTLSHPVLLPIKNGAGRCTIIPNIVALKIRRTFPVCDCEAGGRPVLFYKRRLRNPINKSMGSTDQMDLIVRLLFFIHLVLVDMNYAESVIECPCFHHGRYRRGSSNFQKLEIAKS